MLQLVYISTAREPLDGGELKNLLSIARRRNRLCLVTGLLLVGGRRFLQALEGPHLAVLETYRRIRADPRHFAVVELSRRRVEMRDFGNWAMAHRDGGKESDKGDLSAVVAALIEPLEDRNLRALFTGFAELHARAVCDLMDSQGA